jgi:tetratricopeptide (TPR) repeat protein
MSRVLLWMALAAAASCGAVCAQPKVKSQKEYEAYMAIMNAADPDARIAAVNNLLSKYADTELKGAALQVATTSYYEKNDADNVLIWGDRCIQADSKNFTCMVLMSRAIVYRTREFDLDKEEKLGRADKLANQALDLLKTAQKPNPEIPDDQWEAGKKDYMGQCEEALGMSSLLRKQYEPAIEHFKQAQALSPQPSADTYARMAIAYNSLGKYDDALAAADKALADANAPSGIKQMASQEKMKANQGKAKAAAPAKP